jgi:hypothetical protein
VTDISQWVSAAERSLRRLREDRSVLGFAIVHDGGEPRLAITVPFPTDESSPDFYAERLEVAYTKIRKVLPRSIPFQIVGSRRDQSRG